MCPICFYSFLGVQVQMSYRLGRMSFSCSRTSVSGVSVSGDINAYQSDMTNAIASSVATVCGSDSYDHLF